jgi:hypothetical protein
MGWALVALVLSALLVAASFALNAFLGQGYAALSVIMPASAISDRLLHHRVTFTSAVVATVALYWPMMLCICIAAADRRRISQAMSARRAELAVGIGTAISGLLYVLTRGGPIEMIPNLPGILILSIWGIGSSTRLFELLFIANTVWYSFAAFLVLFRLFWRRPA